MTPGIGPRRRIGHAATNLTTASTLLRRPATGGDAASNLTGVKLVTSRWLGFLAWPRGTSTSCSSATTMRCTPRPREPAEEVMAAQGSVVVADDGRPRAHPGTALYLSAPFPTVDAQTEEPMTLVLYANGGSTADHASQSPATPTTFPPIHGSGLLRPHSKLAPPPVRGEYERLPTPLPSLSLRHGTRPRWWRVDRDPLGVDRPAQSRWRRQASGLSAPLTPSRGWPAAVRRGPFAQGWTCGHQNPFRPRFEGAGFCQGGYGP
jgi:hypothetical protein